MRGNCLFPISVGICALNWITELVWYFHFMEEKINVFWVLKTTAIHKKGDSWQNSLRDACYCLPTRMQVPVPRTSPTRQGGEAAVGSREQSNNICLKSLALQTTGWFLLCRYSAQHPSKCHRASSPSLYPLTLRWFFYIWLLNVS